MFKSQFVSTNIYSDKSEDDDQFMLSLSISNKPVQYPPIQKNIDIQFVQGDLRIGAESIVMKESGAWKGKSMIGRLEVPIQFEFSKLKALLGVFYGNDLAVKRQEATSYLDIVYWLEVNELIKQIEEDFYTNFEQYELFPLLQSVRKHKLIKIEQLCINQLELESYEQFRYAKYDLLNLNEETFKFIVLHHNQRQWDEPGLGHSQKIITELIIEYCRHNKYKQQSKNELVKELVQIFGDRDHYSRVSPLRIKQIYNDDDIKIKVYTPKYKGESEDAKIQFSEESAGKNSYKSLIFTSGTSKDKKKRKESKDSDHTKDITQMLIQIKAQDKAVKEDLANIQLQLSNLSEQTKISIESSESSTKFLKTIEDNLEIVRTDLKDWSKHLQQLQKRLEETELTERSQKNNDDSKQKQLRISLTESRWICC